MHAIKIIDKKALRGKEDSLENEIRVLKRQLLSVCITSLLYHFGCNLRRRKIICVPFNWDSLALLQCLLRSFFFLLLSEIESVIQQLLLHKVRRIKKKFYHKINFIFLLLIMVLRGLIKTNKFLIVNNDCICALTDIICADKKKGFCSILNRGIILHCVLVSFKEMVVLLDINFKIQNILNLLCFKQKKKTLPFRL